MSQAHRLNLSAAGAAIGTALLLVVLKSWAFWATGALSVAASLIDSATDLFASAATLAAILYAARPADDDHRFGHHAAEDVAALVQALVVAASALAIAWRALTHLGAPEPLQAEAVGLGVMAGACAITGALVLWQRHVARRTGSKAVAADAMHYLSDLVPNLAAMAALGLSLGFGILWADPVLSLIAVAVLLRGAWGIGAEAFAALTDRELGPGEQARIEAVVRAHPGVRGVHDLKTRRSGTQVYMQMHLELDGAQTLTAAHDIGASLRLRLREAYPGAEVLIHKDPV